MMSFRAALIIASTLALANCAPTRAVQVSEQQEVGLRSRIAAAVENFGTFVHPYSDARTGGSFFGQNLRTRFVKAEISGPHVVNGLGGTVTAYCVRVEFDKKDMPMFGSHPWAYVTLGEMMADAETGQGTGKVRLQIQGSKGTPSANCKMDQAKPFPELIQLREMSIGRAVQRQKAKAAEAAAPKSEQ